MPIGYLGDGKDLSKFKTSELIKILIETEEWAMTEDDLEKVAKRIYAQHKNIIDYIRANIYDDRDERFLFRDALKEHFDKSNSWLGLACSSRYIKFYHPTWQASVLGASNTFTDLSTDIFNKKGRNHHDVWFPFYWEIVLKETSLRLALVLGPMNDADMRYKLGALINEGKVKRDGTWNRLFSCSLVECDEVIDEIYKKHNDESFVDNLYVRIATKIESSGFNKKVNNAIREFLNDLPRANLSGSMMQEGEV